MKALIDPNTSLIYYVSSWTAPVAPDTNYKPVISTYPNSQRVCQVEPDDKIFIVADPLFWTSCPENTVADQWYYDTSDQTVKEIVNAPQPSLGVA